LATRVDEEIATLKALVDEQRLRLEQLEHGPTNGNGDVHSRRNLLKLAGAGLVGAAGAAAFSVVPAAAATGGNFILGQTNQADTRSTLALTSPFIGGGSIANETVLRLDATNNSTQTGTTDIHGVEGIGFFGGAGVAGASSSGPGGAFGSTTGPDLQLGGVTVNKNRVGSGRLAQLQRSGVAAAGPSFTAAAGMSELIRGTDASMWLSTNGTSGTATANWKRMNTVRVDKADGTGAAFAPARIIDTRSSVGTAGSGLTGNAPLQPGVTYIFGPFTGTNGLPADAIGIVGNVTVVNFTGAGYLSLFPGGAPDPGTSSINFGGEFANSGWANGFTLGFGTGSNAGKISMRLSANGITCHAIIDVTAFLQ
jgi:hypothetical protein